MLQPLKYNVGLKSSIGIAGIAVNVLYLLLLIKDQVMYKTTKCNMKLPFKSYQEFHEDLLLHLCNWVKISNPLLLGNLILMVFGNGSEFEHDHKDFMFKTDVDLTNSVRLHELFSDCTYMHNSEIDLSKHMATAYKLLSENM